MTKYFERLSSMRGAGAMNPTVKAQYLETIQIKVIPAIKDTEEKQRILTAEARTRPVKSVVPRR